MEFIYPALESEQACDCANQQNEEEVMLWDSETPKGLQGMQSFHFLSFGTFSLGMLPFFPSPNTLPPRGEATERGTKVHLLTVKVNCSQECELSWMF